LPSASSANNPFLSQAQQVVVHLPGEDIQAGLGGDLGDACPHLAASDDSDFLHSFPPQ